MKKKVYVSLSADILHKGHISILKKASQLGEVTVGLMTDKAINSYKKIPFLNYFQREIVLKNLKMVKKVIPQNEMDYRKNLRKIKPHYVKIIPSQFSSRKNNIIRKFIKKLFIYNKFWREVTYSRIFKQLMPKWIRFKIYGYLIHSSSVM